MASLLSSVDKSTLLAIETLSGVGLATLTLLSIQSGRLEAMTDPEKEGPRDAALGSPVEAYEFARNLAREHAQVIPVLVYVAVLCLCMVIGHLFEENRWVNKSIAAIIIGCVTGTIILLVSKGKSSHILRFNEELFFIYLLPPIIFNLILRPTQISGTWWLFPKLGFGGLNVRAYLAVGTIFSSTNTVCTLQILHQDVTPLLYSLVFGEGAVNDATSVVLFNAVQKIDVSKLKGATGLRVIGDFLYLFFTSTALGIAVSLPLDRQWKGFKLDIDAYGSFTYSGVTLDPVNATMITNTVKCEFEGVMLQRQGELAWRTTLQHFLVGGFGDLAITAGWHSSVGRIKCCIRRLPWLHQVRSTKSQALETPEAAHSKPNRPSQTNHSAIGKIRPAMNLCTFSYHHSTYKHDLK
ncbi:sodium/hydrogen exchanger 5-like [Pyrus x bretschneideri]|uniref:sodium/hydrogen exchanger 5-like n=1 Tax=Pyrus x bretschneideri TaxID=225117 RepID=UPI00202F59C9|nr:sodium/hydrogen exchanger 5-like [Pyrus x bretschneideri]